MCASSPPPAPDYAGAAAAQGAANKEAAIASSRLNNPNVVNPNGTQTWTEGSTPESRPTLTQTLSPEQQALYNKNAVSKGLLADLGISGATALQDVVGKNLDLGSAPGVGSYDSTRKSVIDAMMGRANEDYGLQTDQANSDLVAAGIRPGTKAYADRMQMIERSRNDARNQAEVAGGNAATQAFNTDTQRRKDTIAEILAQRQTPLNEINALMSGSQVTNPFAVPGAAQNSNVQPAPVFGATQAQAGAAGDAYNANTANSNAQMSGLLSLGALAFSDKRLKSNIVRIGTHGLGIGVYEYDIFGKRERGVIAQELEAVLPSAVFTHSSGFKMVNYGVL